MDFLVMRMRKHAFRAMVRAFLPTISLPYIQVLCVIIGLDGHSVIPSAMIRVHWRDVGFLSGFPLYRSPSIGYTSVLWFHSGIPSCHCPFPSTRTDNQVLRNSHVVLHSLRTPQEQLQFRDKAMLVQFLKRDVQAVFMAREAGEEPAVDVKATRTAWTQQGMWAS